MLSREKIVAGLALPVSFGAGLMVGGRATAVGVVLFAGALAAWAAVVLRGRGRSARAHAAHGDALARERVLGELGRALLPAGDPAGMRRAVATAAEDLLRDCPGGWASVLSMGSDGSPVESPAAAGPTGDEAAGRLPAAALPHDLLARLAAGDTVSAASPADLGLAGLGTDRPVTLLPLVHGERFFGILACGADEPVPAGAMAALHAVRTQASLALHGEALAAELDHRSTRDPLTGVGNRGLLRDRLTAALARARRSGRPVGVLLLDLQGFRQVNEVHGHEVGDELLRVVADRLRAGVRVEDTIGRLGGDQFAVIAEDLWTAQDVVLIAERLIGELGRTVPVAGRVVRAPASVGIALSHPDTAGPDQLLGEAEAATAAAKQYGGGRYHLHGATPA